MLAIPIRIEHDDLVKGIINSPTSDPVALALQRAGLTNPIVGERRVSFSQGPTRMFLDLPLNLRLFRRKLAYGDRFEALQVIRDKKGNLTGHKPFEATLTVGPQLQHQKAA